MVVAGTARASLALALGLASACVNDYVVDDRSAGSTSCASACGDDGIATKAGDPTAVTMGDGNGMGDTVASPGDGSSTSSGDADGDGSPCSRCTHDDACGGDYDNCIELAPGELRCAKVCAEPPNACPEGYSCTSTVSVDGFAADQCLPDAGLCS